jgi:DNA-binding PadR family transcriptional regulator
VSNSDISFNDINRDDQPVHHKPSEQTDGPKSTVKSLGKGYMRAIILALLADHPRYGYDILDTLAEASDGWRPSPGTIYPILHDLNERGWITKKEVEEDGRRRITYQLGARGKRHLEHDAMEHVRFVAIMRKILAKHGEPHFLGAPAFDVDKALRQLHHMDLLLDEVSLLPQQVTGDREQSVALLKRRFRILEKHAGNIDKAIQKIKKEIQALEEA